MKEKNHSILRGVRAFSPLLQAYEAGYTVEEIKSSVVEALAPEFENLALLDRYGIDLLTVEAVNITKIRNSSWASNLFDQCLHIRRQHFTNAPDDCAKTCASPRVTIVVAFLEPKNTGAAMKEICGTLRTIIQRPCSGSAVAA